MMRVLMAVSLDRVEFSTSQPRAPTRKAGDLWVRWPVFLSPSSMPSAGLDSTRERLAGRRAEAAHGSGHCQLAPHGHAAGVELRAPSCGERLHELQSAAADGQG